jgi:hypothetical protein
MQQMIPFSKYFSTIVLKRSFKGTYSYETGKSAIESVWYCNKTGTLYAYYRSSGLRAISTSLYVEMCALPDDGKRYIYQEGILTEVTPNGAVLLS